MYIEMKKTGLDVSDLITLVQRKGGGNTGFPYKSFVCRCSNCLYSTNKIARIKKEKQAASKNAPAMEPVKVPVPKPKER